MMWRVVIARGSFRGRFLCLSAWWFLRASPALAGASLSGLAWEDADGDGTRNVAEPGLPGVIVYLDLNRNGMMDGAERRVLSMEDDPNTAFDETGSFFISDLAAGTYAVGEIVPERYIQTFPPSGGYTLNIQDSQHVDGINFGNQPVVTAFLSGRVWCDNDGDGRPGAGEGGAAGEVVFLDADNNGTLDPGELRTTALADDPFTRFDESGLYSISVATPGEHVVRLIVPSGFIQTAPAGGAPHLAVLASGQGASGLEFGLAPRPSFATLRGIARQGSLVIIQLIGAPGQEYHEYLSANLQDWLPTGRVIVGLGYVQSVTLNSGSEPALFFRYKQQ